MTTCAGLIWAIDTETPMYVDRIMSRDVLQVAEDARVTQPAALMRGPSGVKLVRVELAPVSRAV